MALFSRATNLYSRAGAKRLAPSAEYGIRLLPATTGYTGHARLETARAAPCNSEGMVDSFLWQREVNLPGLSRL